MPVDASIIVDLVSLALTGGVTAYATLFMRRANRQLTEAQAKLAEAQAKLAEAGADKEKAEAGHKKAEAAQTLVDTAEDVIRQLRDQMHQLEVNRAYDKERIDDLEQKSAEMRINQERTIEELTAAQLEIGRLVAEKDTQAKKIQAQEQTIRALECEVLVLRDKLAKYEDKEAGRD